MGCGFHRLPLKYFYFLSSLVFLSWPGICLAQIPGQTTGPASGRILVRVHEGDGSALRLSAMVTLRSPSQLTNATIPTTDAGQALFTGLSA
jgi:hypothetical protein